MVPANDVFALDDMLLEVLALDKTVAVVVAVEDGDSADVDATLDAAVVVLTLPETKADVVEAGAETPAVEEGLKQRVTRRSATTPEPAPDDEPAVFDDRRGRDAAGQRGLDVDIVQLLRVELELRVGFQNHVILIQLRVQGVDLALPEGVVERVVDGGGRDAEA